MSLKIIKKHLLKVFYYIQKISGKKTTILTEEQYLLKTFTIYYQNK